MGKALEVVTGTVTFSNNAFVAVTAAAGNTMQVRNGKEGSIIRLLQAWADLQFLGTVRIRSPRLNDVNQGIRLAVTASDVKPLLPYFFNQPLFPNDALTVEISAPDAAGDVETISFLTYYDDLPGAEAHLITAEELRRRMVEIHPIESTIALGVAGGYSGQEAINAEFDFLKANREYALLGYMVTVECATVRWVGADVGNLGVGGPGDELGRDFTRTWFLDLAESTGLATIPVFNANNRGGILIDGAQDENGADTTVTSIFALLS